MLLISDYDAKTGMVAVTDTDDSSTEALTIMAVDALVKAGVPVKGYNNGKITVCNIKTIEISVDILETYRTSKTNVFKIVSFNNASCLNNCQIVYKLDDVSIYYSNDGSECYIISENRLVLKNIPNDYPVRITTN